MDHDGTIRHCTALLPDWKFPIGERHGNSYARILAPLPVDAIDLSQGKRVGSAELNQNLPSIQRCEQRNITIVPAVNAVIKILGEADATHPPGHAGRALRHGDGRIEPAVFDTHQNFRGAAATASGASRITQRGEEAREAAGARQRPHTLNDAASILRDLLAAVEEWRREARHRLAEWRRLHQEPERAAFQAAVARSRA